MATSETNANATPWLAFLVGIVLIGVLAFGYFAMTGGNGEDRVAELEINTPMNAPNLGPAPAVTPAAPAAPEAVDGDSEAAPAVGPVPTTEPEAVVP